MHRDADLSLAARRATVNVEVLLGQLVNDVVGTFGRKANHRSAHDYRGVEVVGVGQ
jgi:hypothetical protein